MAKDLLTAAALAAALAGCGPAPGGARACAEGRWADARREFAAAIAEAGEGAPAELLHDAALAALRDGALDEAEALAGRAGPGGDFLRGHAAFLRSDGPDLDRAIRHAEAARDLWARAAAALPDLPAARRNAERAVLRLEDLARRREQAARAAGPGGKPRAVVLPGTGGKTPEPAAPGAAAGELPPGEVLGVLDRVEEKEREKRALRLSRRREGGGSAERDW